MASANQHFWNKIVDEPLTAIHLADIIGSKTPFCSVFAEIPPVFLSNRGESRGSYRVDTLTLFGLFAVGAMLLCYALEDRSAWFILAFAVACALGSAYGFLQGAWPFGVVEAIWALVALRRWAARRGSPAGKAA